MADEMLRIVAQAHASLASRSRRAPTIHTTAPKQVPAQMVATKKIATISSLCIFFFKKKKKKKKRTGEKTEVWSRHNAEQLG